ncbi:hypothetical protein DPEC_G00060820 [Dallia pectoralis]|uniref:Uncharacterized protein n=1 Tax=Dallia pectoralis TaxID=75939 RepID=A0ACC2H717_DALPE|nr:hypothetical protein DPEC_G00060820 [Dallia pectoralis]
MSLNENVQWDSERDRLVRENVELEELMAAMKVLRLQNAERENIGSMIRNRRTPLIGKTFAGRLKCPTEVQITKEQKRLWRGMRAGAVDKLTVQLSAIFNSDVRPAALNDTFSFSARSKNEPMVYRKRKALRQYPRPQPPVC